MYICNLNNYIYRVYIYICIICNLNNYKYIYIYIYNNHHYHWILIGGEPWQGSIRSGDGNGRVTFEQFLRIFKPKLSERQGSHLAESWLRSRTVMESALHTHLVRFCGFQNRPCLLNIKSPLAFPEHVVVNLQRWIHLYNVVAQEWHLDEI